MSRFLSACSASCEYSSYGDELPSKEALGEFAESLERSSNPRYIITHADVLVDLAVADPDHAKDYVSYADDKLRELGRSSASDEDGLRYRVESQLKKAELGGWLRAAQGSAMGKLSYEELLLGAANAVWLRRKNPSVKSIGPLREFCLVLLSSRLSDPAHSLASRLSLSREDARAGHLVSNLHNPNWDVGFGFDKSAESFTSPPVKVQVKRIFNSDQRAAYARAGVVCLSTALHSIDEPRGLIDSCLEEYDRTPGKSPRYTSYDLDRLTRKIGETITNGAQSFIVPEQQLAYS